MDLIHGERNGEALGHGKGPGVPVHVQSLDLDLLGIDGDVNALPDEMDDGQKSCNERQDRETRGEAEHGPEKMTTPTEPFAVDR